MFGLRFFFFTAVVVLHAKAINGEQTPKRTQIRTTCYMNGNGKIPKPKPICTFVFSLRCKKIKRKREKEGEK